MQKKKKKSTYNKSRFILNRKFKSKNQIAALLFVVIDW